MRLFPTKPQRHGGIALYAVLAACADQPTGVGISPIEARINAARVQCAPDNGGITLPSGFCAAVVADLVMDGEPARARHMAVTPSGNIFVAINSPRNDNPSFGIIGILDRNGDGRADEQTRFSPGLGGSGLAWGEANLYFGANDRVLRFRLPAGKLIPIGEPEIVVSGLPNSGDHISKTVVLADPHTLFVNIGSASNACQIANREPQSPGVFPCPELPIRAGVWQFNARGTKRSSKTGKFSPRNTVAMVSW